MAVNNVYYVDMEKSSLRYFTSGEIEPWKLGDPRADWACGCTVQELAGMCPVIQRFLKDREAAK